jgi:hypothetical protein
LLAFDPIRAARLPWSLSRATPSIDNQLCDIASARRQPKGIDVGYWEQTVDNLGHDDSRVPDATSNEPSSPSYQAVLRIERRLSQLVSALGLLGIEPCSVCGNFFRSSAPAAHFNGSGERVCIGCVHEWWPMRCEQLDTADRETLERKLIPWLVNYHNGRVIREFHQVLQIPMQEFRIVTTCFECKGKGNNCRFCDGHGTIWVVAPE